MISLGSHPGRKEVTSQVASQSASRSTADRAWAQYEYEAVGVKHFPHLAQTTVHSDMISVKAQVIDIHMVVHRTRPAELCASFPSENTMALPLSFARRESRSEGMIRMSFSDTRCPGVDELGVARCPSLQNLTLLHAHPVGGNGIQAEILSKPSRLTKPMEAVPNIAEPNYDLPLANEGLVLGCTWQGAVRDEEFDLGEAV